MNRYILLLFLIIGGCHLTAQHVAIKNNILYDVTGTPNLGIELGISKHLSLDISGRYHPWSFKNDKSFQHWAIQPELRYWIFERFDGHYFGLHGQYMDYEFSGLNLLWGMDKEYQYIGDVWGGGLSYGYHLYLSPRWNIEFTIGGGFNRFKYFKYELEEENKGDNLGEFKRDYYGITKLGVSIVYIIK